MIFLGGAVNIYSSMVSRYGETKLKNLQNMASYTDIAKAFVADPQKAFQFSVTIHGLAAAHAISVSIINVLTSATFKKEFFHLAAKETIWEIQKLLEPLKRTGTTAQNWHYRIGLINKDTVTILPTDDNIAARAIQNGIGVKNPRRPPKDDLLKWMGTKPEFAPLPDDLKDRIAYFISKKIGENRPPGKNSDIARLKPTGTRQFSYIEEAARNTFVKIEEALEQIAGRYDG